MESIKNTMLTKAREKEIDFKIDSENEEIINLISAYFERNPSFEEQGYSFKKGLMLFGDIGCGKTTIMKLLEVNNLRPYSVVNCRKVASDYGIGGDEAIEKYYKRSDTFKDSSRAFCFDDFGAEPDKMYFGSRINVMEDIIIHRYATGGPFFTTHLTTNKTATEIKERYGDRVASRLREMFNLILFPNNAQDRRK